MLCMQVSKRYHFLDAELKVQLWLTTQTIRDTTS